MYGRAEGPFHDRRDEILRVADIAELRERHLADVIRAERRAEITTLTGLIEGDESNDAA